MKGLILSASEEMQWAAEIQRGNKSAFKKLFNAYYDPLCQYAFRFCNGDIEVVEDVVQEVFVRIWEKRESWSPQIAVKAYLYRSVHNQAISNIRKRRYESPMEASVESTVLSADHSPLDLIHQKEVNVSLQRAINKLPERRREILVLRILHEMSYKEIAEMLDISVNTVDTQLRRALKLLREELSVYNIPALEAA